MPALRFSAFHYYDAADHFITPPFSSLYLADYFITFDTDAIIIFITPFLH
jgi:hypothetical protein